MTFVQREGGPRLFTRVDAPAARPDAPWIVLSHSLAANHAMWDAQIDLLTSRFRVLRYDTRGHGASEAPPSPYDFDMLVGDVLAILDRYEIASVTFMGLSLGGMTGLGLALDHASRIDRLICCDARADTAPAFAKNWDDRIAAIHRLGGMHAIAKSTVERWLSPAFRAADPAETDRIEAMVLSTPVAGYEGCAEAIKGLDYLRRLPAIRVPCHFIVGEIDAGAPPADMRVMAAAVPGATYTEIPGGAHVTNVDSAAAFNRVIAGILDLP